MIDAHTDLYCVIGNPVRHSLSPILHNGVFRRMGYPAVYVAFEVNEDLEGAMAGMRALGIRGASVTIPYKTRVIPYLQGLEGMAQKIQAVNTICRKDGKLIGYNTDWLGAVDSLRQKIPLKGKKAFLVGAGGSARAIAFGLKEEGVEVAIFNRSPKKAADLAAELGVESAPLSSLSRARGDILINATPVGMAPRPDESPVPREALQEGMIVMDIVYHPLETRLLRDAEERRCRTIHGLEMLARQGAAQVEIWTGKKPEIRPILEDLRTFSRSAS